MRNYIVNAVTIALLWGAATSCTANYENINGNPYQPSDEQMTADDYAFGAAMNSLAGGVVSPDINRTQFTECLLGGPLGGYFASIATWTATIENYNPTDNWTLVFMKDVVPTIYSNLDAVKTISAQTGNPVSMAIANIMKVAGMHRVADTYGPIPYTQIGDSFAAPYDSVETVYTAFFDDLNASIATLTENSTAAFTATADNVFKGDVQKWIRFANSLKLRLAMRIVYADPTKAKKMAEEAVAHEYGVITANADNALFTAFGSNGNPISYAAVGYNDSKAAADIVCYMNGYNDPRRAAYFTTSTWEGRTFVGARHGISPIPNKNEVGAKYSSPNIKAADPVQWMNAAEVAFLRAEAVAVFGFDMGGTAEAFYKDGIRLSFEQWGASGVDSYMANSTDTAQTYDDPNGGTNSYSRTISTITIAWDENATTEQKQERIITQKWIANWSIGNEAWADYRRTGYPHLIPATEAGNKSGGVVDSALGARRMPYPLDEYVNNTANITAAVSQHLKGADNMATRLWWDCKTIKN